MLHMMKITAHACTSGHWEMLPNCPLLQRSLSSSPRSTSEAFLIPHSASVTQVPCPTLLTSGVLHYLFSCFCTPPKKINKSRANVLPYRPDSPVSREGDHKNCNKLLWTGRWYLMWWEEHNIWRIWSGQLSELPVHEFSSHLWPL